MRLNEIAMQAIENQRAITPYRTGNLLNSMGDLSGFDNETRYIAFNANRRADYGAILNNNKTIKYIKKENGKQTIIERPNKHYKWFDNYFWQEARNIDNTLGLQGEQI